MKTIKTIFKLRHDKIDHGHGSEHTERSLHRPRSCNEPLEFNGFEQLECGLYCVVRMEDDAHASSSRPGPGAVSSLVSVPLKSVSIVASVTHSVAKVEVTQIFVNEGKEVIEAIYYYPVHPNGVVTQFNIQVEGGRRHEGSVKTNEESRSVYERAIRAKQTAFLGEENRQDIFKVWVGFLIPGSRAKIVMGYVTEVKIEKSIASNCHRLCIPTTVAPRYVPERCTTEEISRNLANMPFSEISPALVSILVTVSMQSGVKSIISPTHDIIVNMEEGHRTVFGGLASSNLSTAVVELTKKVTEMDRDFVLHIIPIEGHKPRLYVEQLRSSVAIMAHVIPNLRPRHQNQTQKSEFIFLLDRSGSMQGPSMELAKKALIIFFDSLPSDCYFNVIGCGSFYSMLFPGGSVKKDDSSLDAAVQYVEETRADLCGTEIVEALQEIYAGERIPRHLHQIFILTDGHVGNTEDIIGLVKTNALTCHDDAHNKSRVFVLGIGHGASHYFVQGLADAGGGTSAIINENEPLVKKVQQLLKDATQPPLTGAKVEWHGIHPAPEKVKSVIKMHEEGTLWSGVASYLTRGHLTKPKFRVPDQASSIVHGSPLFIFGIFDEGQEGGYRPSGVTITADAPDGTPWSVRIELSREVISTSGGVLHKLAAMTMVREMEVKISALEFQLCNYITWFENYEKEREEKEAAVKELKMKMVQVALSHGIASKVTSFVAVDAGAAHRAPCSVNGNEIDNTKQYSWITMKTLPVPSKIPHGWHRQELTTATTPVTVTSTNSSTCSNGRSRTEGTPKIFNRRRISKIQSQALEEGYMYMYISRR